MLGPYRDLLATPGGLRLSASAFVALDEFRKAGLLGYDLPAEVPEIAEDPINP